MTLYHPETQAIRNLMQQHNITQTELAYRLNVPYSSLNAYLLYGYGLKRRGLDREKIIEAIKAGSEEVEPKEVEPMNTCWISTEERLPDHDGTVLTCTDKGKVCFSKWSAEQGCFHGPSRKSVTYWMPLPTPPACSLATLRDAAASIGYKLVKEEW